VTVDELLDSLPYVIFRFDQPAGVWVAKLDAGPIYSQARTKPDALKAILSAVALHIRTSAALVELED
jgi:hypothetical protein